MQWFTLSSEQTRLISWLEVILIILSISDQTSPTENLGVGKAMNVFGRFAYYGISMKVVGRNDSIKPWLFREPLVEVFNNISSSVCCLKKPHILFHGEFHLEFCENIQQLLHAYFRDFNIEGMDESWRAFTSSWNENTISKNFGIDVNYITTQRSYILVRAQRRRKCQSLPNPLEGADAEPLPSVEELAEGVKYGDKESVMKFIKTYGSHYISSYSTGNSLYQVFVFHTPVFRRVRARLQAEGVNALSKNELGTIFSPWYAEQVGTVLSASGNRTLTAWAERFLTSRSHLYPYTSLMSLYGNIDKFKELDHLLENEALLSLQLKTMSTIFKDPEKRLWFLEYLYNNMQLWEQNMYSFLG